MDCCQGCLVLLAFCGFELLQPMNTRGQRSQIQTWMNGDMVTSEKRHFKVYNCSYLTYDPSQYKPILSFFDLLLEIFFVS